MGCSTTASALVPSITTGGPGWSSDGACSAPSTLLPGHGEIMLRATEYKNLGGPHRLRPFYPFEHCPVPKATSTLVSLVVSTPNFPPSPYLFCYPFITRLVVAS